MGEPAKAHRRFSEEEYLAFERNSERKHEFFDGEIVAMAGGHPDHSLIATNLAIALGSALKGRCLIYNSDLRVKVEQTGFLAYPDVTIARGERKFDDDSLLTPTLLAEVLSESTEAYDRGFKFEQFKRVPSLNTYLLISHDQARVEQYFRQPNGKWEYSDALGVESTLSIPGLGITLALSDVFANVTFPPRAIRKPTGTGPTAGAE